MGIDFRPSNYFGVTGNKRDTREWPAARFKRHADQDHAQGKFLPAGIAISAWRTVERSIQPAPDQCHPARHAICRCALILFWKRRSSWSTSVAKVQTVSTERLLRNTTGVSVAFPGFVDALISTGDRFLHSEWAPEPATSIPKSSNKLDKYWSVLDDTAHKQLDDIAKLALDSRTNRRIQDKSLYSADSTRLEPTFLAVVGSLESSHINDLFPVVESVRALADAVPKILSPDSFAYTLTEITTAT